MVNKIANANFESMLTAYSATAQKSRNKLLVNGSLFFRLREQTNIDNKLQSLEECLCQGADVNASDANDDNNTPLHIATIEIEPKVVKFLLQKNANANAMNIIRLTPLDIAKGILKQCFIDNRRLSTNEAIKAEKVIEVIQLLQTATLSIPNPSIDSVHIEELPSTSDSEVRIKEAKPLTDKSRFSKHLYEKDFLGLLTQNKELAEKEVSEKKTQSVTLTTNKTVRTNKAKQLNTDIRSGTAGISRQLCKTNLSGLLDANKDLAQTKVSKAELQNDLPLTSNDEVGIIKVKQLTSKKKPQNLPSTTHKIVQTNKSKPLTNESRPGTAGISGQLYETNLLGLLLHRALIDMHINEFYLGTNIKELGAFDDIVFKYYIKDQNPKIFFVQAKHRDNPTKEKLTVNSVLKSNNDFSLDKYYESYIKIKKKFNKKCENVMFQSDFHNLDSCFLLYTPTFEDFNKKKLIEISGKETLLLTNINGKAFMFDYDDDDINMVYNNTLFPIATSLAKAFAEKIETENYKNMMLAESIRVYHVFLAQNIVEITSKSKNYLTGKFRKKFLESSDSIFVHMKEIIFKKLKLHDSLSINSNEIEREFKLPITFGNLEIVINEKEIDDICKIIQKLMNFGENLDHDNMIVIALDDEMIGRYKSIQNKDITMVGNLVGETLVNDDETGLLKFNFKESPLDNNTILLEMIKNKIVPERELKRVRFEINVQNFPQLSLCNEKLQKRNIMEFLSKLKFYTNQAKQENVEDILKNEINNCYITEIKNSDTLCYIKGDAIYRKYHDSIQKWWKNPDEYLTKSCQFYEEAKNNILYSPVVNVLNYLYVTKINRFDLGFDQKAVDLLGLQKFIKTSNERVFHIRTVDSALTSIKIIQYFRNNASLKDYKFVNLDSITAQGEDIMRDISKNKLVDVIILVFSNANPKIGVYVNFVVKNFNKQVICISPSNSLQEDIKTNFNFIEQTDENNSLSDFDENTKSRVIKQKNILFQGIELVYFTSLVDENMHKLIKGEVLHTIVNNETIKIGKEPTDIKAFSETKELYVNRQVWRNLKLSEEQLTEKICNDFNIVHDTNIATPFFLEDKDILIISNDIVAFYEACKKHDKVNIHWFRKEDGYIMWKKSHGSIKKIIPHVERCIEVAYLLEPQTLKDLDDRIVIISGGPGMGKSTLVTQLMMQTKHLDKSMCIIKINVKDLINDFSTWQNCDEEMRLRRILSALYTSYSIYSNYYKNFIENFFFRAAIFDTDRKILFNSELEINKEHNLVFFELQIFLGRYNNSKIATILDGFDEICPNYRKEVINLFKVLITSHIQHLWITSRSNINELECELNTFSFALKGFSKNDQVSFFKKFISSRNQQTKYEKEIMPELFKIKCDDANLIKIIDSSSSGAQRQRDVGQVFSGRPYVLPYLHLLLDQDLLFKGTPLHLRMFAEMYKNIDTSEYISVLSLYEMFLDFKFFMIRFGKDNKRIFYNNTDLKTFLRKELDSMMQNHKILAAYLLLDKIILTEADWQSIDNFIKKNDIWDDKTGIIESINQNKPKFMHFTFAEYFATELVCDKIRQNVFTEHAWKYFINDILCTGDGGIRWFMDSKLESDQQLVNVTSKHISDNLLMQRLNFESALDVALRENCYNIALFLLNNLYAHLTLNKLEDFIDLITQNRTTCNLCFELHPRNKQVVAKIIRIIKHLDVKKLLNLYFLRDGPNFDLFKHSILSHRFITGELEYVELMSPDDLTKLLTTLSISDNTRKQSILHIILNENKHLYMLKYLEKLNHDQQELVFSFKDKWKRIPAHYAAKMRNYKFFELMANLVGIQCFRQICTYTDKYGIIPLRYFEPKTTALILDDDDDDDDEPLRYYDTKTTAFIEDNEIDDDFDGDFYYDTTTEDAILCNYKFKSICNKAGIDFSLNAEGGLHILHDIENPYCIW